MKSYLLSDIEYDTDDTGDADISDIDLPNKIIVVIDEVGKTEDEIRDELSDAITNETGFCHRGFNWEPSPY